MNEQKESGTDKASARRRKPRGPSFSLPRALAGTALLEGRAKHLGPAAVKFGGIAPSTARNPTDNGLTYANMTRDALTLHPELAPAVAKSKAFSVVVEILEDIEQPANTRVVAALGL